MTDTPESAPVLGRPGQAYAATRLRWAALGDAERLCTLWRGAYPDSDETEAAMCPWLEHGGALMLLDATGTLLAALRWRPNAHGWEVDRVATLPRHRGQGYGRWLLTKVEAAAIRANIPVLSLSLPSDASTGQLAYYARIGYLETRRDGDRIDLHKRVGGTWQTKRPGSNGTHGTAA